MNDSPPRVSIGMPVYNGMPYVEEAICSVLSQSFRDFELVISDNASTDDTELICRRYAAVDSRIRYVRNQRNIGAAANFNRVFELASGKYFKWATGDNAIEPTFLQRCLEKFEENPTAVLTYTRCRQRNEFTDSIRTITKVRNMESSEVRERFRRVFSDIIGMQDAIWGLMRRDAVGRTQRIGGFIGADDCFLIEMALQGPFIEVQEHLLLLRIHPQGFHAMGKTKGWWKVKPGQKRWWQHGYSRQENVRQARWYDPNNEGRIYFPHWRRLREFAALAIRAQDASLADKLHMLGTLARLGIHRRRLLASEGVQALAFSPEALGWKETAPVPEAPAVEVPQAVPQTPTRVRHIS